MSKSLTAHRLYQLFSERLSLQWLTNETTDNRHQAIIPPENQYRSLVGHLNLVRPHYIQVIGHEEIDYLSSLGKNSLQDALTSLLNFPPVIVIMADAVEALPSLLDKANHDKVPVISSTESSIKLIDTLHYQFSNIFSKHITKHGVFMEVMGIGVLLTGYSNIGKSELALALISRGHRLIADDVAEFTRDAPDVIVGTCPSLLRDFLEVRGLGILNIRAMYGDNSIVKSKRLRLIIQLVEHSSEENNDIDRLGRKSRSINIIDVEIPEVIIPVAPGRHLAVIVEAAVRNHVLILNGYDATSDFIERQKELISKKESK